MVVPVATRIESWRAVAASSARSTRVVMTAPERRLAADLASAGLSLGGGAIAGAIVGGLGLMVLRFALLGFFPNQHVAVWTQILHGSTVVAIYVVPPIYLNALAGDHFRSSIQGLYAMTVFGPSRIVGNILGGELAEQSLPMMFIVFSITTLVAVIGLALTMRLPKETIEAPRDVPPMVEGD